MENTVLFNALVHEVNASESIAKCCTESEFIQYYKNIHLLTSCRHFKQITILHCIVHNLSEIVLVTLVICMDCKSSCDMCDCVKSATHFPHFHLS